MKARLDFIQFKSLCFHDTYTFTDEYYVEVWRRMITFYGNNLLHLESYFNSVLNGKRIICISIFINTDI